jgi:hypothetical protein
MYEITGAYPPNGENNFWYLEFDNLNTTIYTSTQLMELDNWGYERPDIWKKTDFGFEIGKFVENAATSSIVKRVSVPTSLTGSEGDKGGMIAFNSEAIYFANDSYYGTGPFTSSLYQDVNSSPNFPITKGNFPKPKIGWSVSSANGQLQATVTNVEEYTDYWLLYTNGGNSSIGIPATFTLDANGIFDNVWLKQEFISSSIVSSLNSKTGSYATTGSNSFNGNQIVTGSVTATSFIKTGGTSSEYLMADGSVRVPSYGILYLPPSASVTISTVGVWQPIGLVATLVSPSPGFSLGLSDKCALKNISGSVKTVNVSCNAFTSLATGFDYPNFSLALNGTLIEGTATTNGYGWSIDWVVVMQNGDEISTYIRSQYNNSGIIYNLRMCIYEI